MIPGPYPTLLPEDVDLRVDIGTVSLKNPVMLASGTAGYGPELYGQIPLEQLGGFVTKGIARRPWEGNAPPRIAETEAGMLNAIGLQNVGLDAFLADKAPLLATIGCPVAVNIIGKTVEEYADVAAGLRGCAAVAALEVNISCPNIKEGGIQFGTDCGLAAEVCRAVVAVADKPVWVKLSPNVGDIAAMGRAVQDAGAHGLSVINTVLGLAIDLKTRRPKLHIGAGGYSGPGIKPIAVRMVHQVARMCSIPVLGMGGICTGEDAIEFMMAGAACVQVGTATVRKPTAAFDIIDEMRQWLARDGVRSVRDIVGTVRM